MNSIEANNIMKILDTTPGDAGSRSRVIFEGNFKAWEVENDFPTWMGEEARGEGREAEYSLGVYGKSVTNSDVVLLEPRIWLMSNQHRDNEDIEVEDVFTLWKGESENDQEQKDLNGEMFRDRRVSQPEKRIF